MIGLHNLLSIILKMKFKSVVIIYTLMLQSVIDDKAFVADFIDKYTIPTMMVDGTSDQFFLPDDSHLFFSQIPGPKYML